MANNFKDDNSFLKKLAIGAAGTNFCILRLKELGFEPIELERGSTSFKIWKKIKIKRVRLPDILCLKTGKRFESRGKTKMEISMSHSLNDPKRTWDFGLQDDDFVSVVLLEQKADSIVEWSKASPVHFIKVSDLKNSFNNGQISTTKPKGVEEGSEVRVLWTSASANQKSIISTIDDDKVTLIPLSTTDRRQSIQLIRGKGKIKLIPQGNVNDIIEKNQIVAAVVPVYIDLRCPPIVNENYFNNSLNSPHLAERYAAAKALRYKDFEFSGPNLKTRMNDPLEDIYVRLEAASALAAHDDNEAWDFLKDKIHSSILSTPLETQLETIIVLSEIQKQKSECLLIDVLKDNSRNEELRAGAAWALGQFVSKISALALIDTFNSTPIEVKTEAARSLLKIAEPQVEYLVDMLKTQDFSKRDGISWVLSKIGGFDLAPLLSGTDDNLRRWISFIAGAGKSKFNEADLNAICKADAEVYFAASVLWQILESWTNNLKEY